MKTRFLTLMQPFMTLALLGFLFACTKPDVIRPTDPSPVGGGSGGQHAPTLTIQVKAVIKIGEVVYDSIPAKLTVTSYDNTGQAHVKNVQMVEGVNLVVIPGNHLRYLLEVERWGVHDQMLLNRSDVHEDWVYLLGGSRAAKQLQYEQRMILENGVYRATHRTEYTYNTSGQLIQANFLSKKADGSIQLDATEELIVQQGKVKAILRKDGLGNPISRLDIQYDQQGKINTMQERAGGVETYATVSYAVTKNGIEKVLHYVYSNTSITMAHRKLLSNGNQVSSSFVYSNHNSELAICTFDQFINPYIHMNWPDISLSRSSRNNVNWQRKEYYGAYPEADPVNFRYTYDTEGYPVSLLQDHRATVGGQILYTTKTIYHYK